MELFGSSGIRGLVNKKITPDLALKVGKAVGRQYDDVILGRDPRVTGDMVSSAVISGLTSQGAEVDVIGIAPTPTLAYATREYDCGVMITASHNPAPYNGIKLWNPDGSSFGTEQMERTEELIFSEKGSPAWSDVGGVNKREGIVDSHIQKIMGKTNTPLDLKVVIDCAGGAGCETTPKLARELGCDVVTLNADFDGTFSSHDPEPTKENLEDLGKMVEDTDADLGLAHDGDADRLVAFDENGGYLGGDELLALFSKRYDERVVVPINSSMVIEELAEEVRRSKVGDVYVAEALKQSGGSFGGEPSGTWIFPEMSYAPDAIFAAALLMEMAQERPLSERMKDIPKYPRKKRSFQVEGKGEKMNKIEKRYRQEHDESDISTVDGIRLESEDGWVLIRASGTEPKIRMTVEAKNKDILNRLYEKNRDMIKEVIR